MLRRILPLAFALCALQLAAQEAPPPPQVPLSATTPKPPAATGRITGIVLCSDTAKPARGIRVNLFGAATPGQHDATDTFVMTDSEGRYIFDRVKPGTYLIRARTNGYLYSPPPQPVAPSLAAVMQDNPSLAVETLTVHPGETVRFDVTLLRSASLSGHVFYEDGSPAIGAEIRVEKIDPKLNQNPQPGSPSYTPILRAFDRALTDERGYFRITTLDSGTYRIAALPIFQRRDSLDDLSDEEEKELKYPGSYVVFSGDTIHRDHAETYKLQPGDEVSDIRITIPLTSLYKVGGAVTANDGRTLNKGMLTLVDATDPDIHFRTTLNTDGSFALAAIPSGTYKLTLSHIYIAGPDKRYRGYSENDAVINTNAFSSVDSSITVKNSDILDLHFEVHEIPLPPQKPDDN